MRQLCCALVVSLLAAGCATPVQAGEDLPAGFDPQRHMRVGDVKQGMTGYGLSVFRGTKIERFDVEVVSVLRNFNPRHDVILVRCAGANLEHTGPIAGMSGSPIYLTDATGKSRLVGAFAYGWPLVKDPLAGVQPIEYMLGLPTEPFKQETAAAPEQTRQSWSLAQAMHVPWSDKSRRHNPFAVELRAQAQAGVAAETPRLRPLLTPLMSAGVPQGVLESMRGPLQACGMMPLESGAFGAPDAPAANIEPGSALAVQLISGDMDLTAMGTTTEVLGDRVLGFGHAFLSEGETALPMASGYIHGVIPNIMNSFKLGSATQTRGTLHADQLVGVGGKLGPAPATVPMEIRVVYTDGTIDKTYRFQAARHPRFTPMLALMAATTAMSSSRELPPQNTLDMDLTMEFEGGRTVRVQNRFAGSNPMDLFQTISGPMQAAAENPFARVMLTKLSGTLKISRQMQQARVLSVNLPRNRYRPGETVEAFVRYRPFRGPESTMSVSFALPRELPDGMYNFAVMDFQQYLMEEQTARPFRFSAESTEEMFKALNDLAGVRRDALYLRILTQPDGVAMGHTAMPKLPSSRRKVMLGAGLSNTSAFVSSTAKVVPTEYVMEGAAQFNITIDRQAKVENPVKGRGEVPKNMAGE